MLQFKSHYIPIVLPASQFWFWASIFKFHSVPIVLQSDWQFQIEPVMYKHTYKTVIHWYRVGVFWWNIKAPFDYVLYYCDTITLKTPKSREKNEGRRYLDSCGIITTEYKWTTYKTKGFKKF